MAFLYLAKFYPDKISFENDRDVIDTLESFRADLAGLDESYENYSLKDILKIVEGDTLFVEEGSMIYSVDFSRINEMIDEHNRLIRAGGCIGCDYLLVSDKNSGNSFDCGYDRGILRDEPLTRKQEFNFRQHIGLKLKSNCEYEKRSVEEIVLDYELSLEKERTSGMVY